jgi:hypothetical protein
MQSEKYKGIHSFPNRAFLLKFNINGHVAGLHFITLKNQFFIELSVIFLVFECSSVSWTQSELTGTEAWILVFGEISIYGMQ